MKIQSIIICSSGYPTPADPIAPFISQIAHAFSRIGIKVSVISPQSIIKHWIRGNELRPKRWMDSYESGKEPIIIYQPYVFSFGDRFEKLNALMRDRAVYKALKANKLQADIFYGHFWHHGYSLYKYAKEKGKPLFVVSGESKISLHNLKKPQALSEFKEYLSGLICVSSKNLEESAAAGLITKKENSIVIPNAIDNDLFHIMNKTELRKKYNIDKDSFIVAFTGWYDENKGVHRVSSAIKNINDHQIKVFFIGDIRDKGGKMPDCEGILHTGILPHEKIAEYLNMADVFVLPTLAEGCNNAIIEAMACGLPIISSNRSFNWDVLNEENSILIDPMNVDEIAKAIESLRDDKVKRDSMSQAALKTAAELTIDKRAERIISFIESKI